MPFETSCDDTQKRHIKVSPNGDLDSPPTYSKVSGAGSFVADADGMGLYVVSEDNVVGNGPFDTVYEVKAMAGGQELTDQITLHVSNDVQTQPATSLGFSADQPEPK
jgi:hypothetical protein